MCDCDISGDTFWFNISSLGLCEINLKYTYLIINIFLIDGVGNTQLTSNNLLGVG